MSHSPKDSPAKAAPEPELDRYLPGDPIPVPHAVEANTESTWAMFLDANRATERGFVDTVPASIMDEQTLESLAKKRPV